jgi:transposase
MVNTIIPGGCSDTGVRNMGVHVLDRYHVMAKMNKAIDEVRAEEAKRLQRDGYEPVLKHSRWVLLKRPENLTEKQAVKLKELRWPPQTQMRSASLSS